MSTNFYAIRHWLLALAIAGGYIPLDLELEVFWPLRDPATPRA